VTTVREALRKDYPSINALFEEVDALHTDAKPDVFRRAPASGRLAEFLDGKRLANDFKMLVAARARAPAEVDAEVEVVVGFATARLLSVPDNPILRAGEYAYVENLVVSSRCRRVGTGAALMSAVQEWARGKGVDRVELDVWEFNRGAIAFYEALGYGTLHRRMSRHVPVSDGG
jgi:ribosomal protein S18 acetylase RimI-like enzyme